MKFLWTLLLALALVLAVGSAQEGEGGGAADGCEQICNERHAELVREKDELWHSREAIIKEKDELWHSREAIIKEKDEAMHEKERALLEVQKLSESTTASDDLKRALEKKESEMAHYQKVAQDNQKYMQEYKNQLASQRDRAAKLKVALAEANKKIAELENTGFFVKLNKEIASGWDAIVKYWTELRDKGKKEDKEF